MSKITKQYSKNQKILEISIDYLSKYSSQPNLYVKFRYFDICYSSFYVICYFIFNFEKFKVHNKF